jgi:protein TonB
MANPATYVRIADRFLGRHSKNSIARSGFLTPVLIVVSAIYICLLAYFIHIEHKLERKRKIVISNLIVQFIAPEPPKVAESPEPMVGNGNSGSTGKPQLGSPPPQVKIERKTAPVVAVATKPPVIKAVNPPAAKVISQPKVSDVPKPAVKPVEENKPNPGTASQGIPTPAATSPQVGAAQVGNATEGNTVGTGTGAGSQPGAGGDSNNGKGTSVAMALPHAAVTGTAMGNIAPYRRDMLMRLAENWHPKKLQGNIVVVITLSSSGQLLNAEILNSSGDEKLDQYALDTVNKTAFAPLPNWFTGSQLRLRVELARVEAMKRAI